MASVIQLLWAFKFNVRTFTGAGYGYFLWGGTCSSKVFFDPSSRPDLCPFPLGRNMLITISCKSLLQEGRERMCGREQALILSFSHTNLRASSRWQSPLLHQVPDLQSLVPSLGTPSTPLRESHVSWIRVRLTREVIDVCCLSNSRLQ
ncbi:hypothetical protein SAY87_012499 [Trapa incisa]|uniref:Uncharacterized protein n=2 Tax=Trapa TaxID=22665 RepID=A0AAN7M1H8_TRANT|nr:hypothetical protein SAY87_012499 [Trapa incisa]KAK4797235.1 hypothetical protein SAY86_029561 [Trapa natans]